MRDQLETQIGDAYEVIISYRAKHYSNEYEETKEPRKRVLTPKEAYFDKLTVFTDIELVRGMAELYE